jgi:hypothetical protein
MTGCQVSQELLDEMLQSYKELMKDRKCRDCGVNQGQAHIPGCDTGMCLACGYQCLGCECAGEPTFGDIWSGLFPGIISAYELKAVGVWCGKICFDLNAVSREAMVAERLKIRDYYSKIPN